MIHVQGNDLLAFCTWVSVPGGMVASIPPIPGGMVNLVIWEGGMVKGGMGSMVDLGEGVWSMGGGMIDLGEYEGSEAAVGGQKNRDLGFKNTRFSG